MRADRSAREEMAGDRGTCAVNAGISRSDMKMYEQAISNRWPIDASRRQSIVDQLSAIVADPKASSREKTAAARALISAERQNQLDEHHRQGREVHHDHVHTVETNRTPVVVDGRHRLLALADRLGIGIVADGVSTDGTVPNPAGDAQQAAGIAG